MASYRIDFKPSVKRDLKSIPRREALTILDAISNLSDNPFPPQSKRLTGREGWRLRVGNYRVTYTVSGGDTTLFVVKVAQLKNIYRSFFTKRSQSHFLNVDA
jgi:mRNA interferase RelE/StbE